MTTSQNIYLHAIEAGKSATPPTSDHEQQTAQLAAFATGNFSPLDYPAWVQVYNRTLSELTNLKGQLSKGEIAAKQKTAGQ
jgi:hypothetical protein